MHLAFGFKAEGIRYLAGHWLLRTLALLFLGSVAALKIVIALSRGRTNIVFLIILSVVFGAIIYLVTNPSRTAAGDAMLSDLRTLFAAVKARAGLRLYTPGTGGHEVALLAAVLLFLLPVDVARGRFTLDHPAGAGAALQPVPLHQSVEGGAVHAQVRRELTLGGETAPRRMLAAQDAYEQGVCDHFGRSTCGLLA